jgi:hypothetical protein
MMGLTKKKKKRKKGEGIFWNNEIGLPKNEGKIVQLVPVVCLNNKSLPVVSNLIQKPL